MAIIEVPDWFDSSVVGMSLSPNANARQFQSAITGRMQTVGRPGGFWRATLTFEDCNPMRAGDLRSMLAKLKGGANRLKLWPLEQPIPKGSARGEPKIDGANQVGSVMNIKDLQPGMSFEAGDYVRFAAHLNMITDRAIAGPDGKCAINLAFDVLTAPSNNAPIVWDRPHAIWCLDSSAGPGWDRAEYWTRFDPWQLVEDVTE